MKPIIKQLLIGVLIGLPIVCNAQFLLNFPFNDYVRTSNPGTLQKVGIGNFPTNASVQAKLHVNSFLLAANPATNGRLFRTDGDSTLNNMWQLFTGANATAQTERFRLMIPSNSNDVQLRATQNGSMSFFTNNTQRMTILNNGQVGIGWVNPDMPLTIMGGMNDVTTSGWRRGIHMLNHSVISWSNTLNSPGFYMGMPNWPADHSFYCAMATNLQGTGVSNFVYRIVNNPIIGTTSPNQGDMDYFHSINIYKNLGIGLNAGVSNILNPTNRVEINTTATSGGMAPPVLAPNGNSGSNVPNSGGGTGFSGLRFTDLRAGSTPYSANPGSGVLAVDANGDVIYVPDAINNATNANNGCSIDPLNPDIVQWGQDINAAGNPAQLLNNREIPLMNKNAYFLGQNSTTQGINAIGIGYPNTVAQLPARMSVWENPGQNVSFNTVGILGLNSSTPALISGLSFVGVAGYANGIDSMENKNEHIGGYFRADGGLINYGVKGIASMGHPSFGNKNYGGDFLADANQSNSANHGVHSMALNGQISYAGWFAAGGAQTENIGLNTMASGNTMSSVNIGIRTSAGGLPGSYTYAIYAQAPVDSGFSYAGWFEGDVHVNGVVTTSDSTIKENINPLQSVSQQLSQLNPVSFNYKQNAVPQLTLDTKQHFGLLAQEVELIWPALVQNSQIAPVFDSTGAIIHPAATIKSLNYTELIALLIAGYKEQEEKIKQQDSILQNIQQEIQMLTGMITKCCSQSQPMLTSGNNQQYPSIQHQYTMDITLRNEDMIVLNQNAPNPFKEQTTITWYLPERVQRAQLIFTNNWGQVIKMADIRETGHGRIIVYADDLSSGIYNYSLVADGQIIETKRMSKVD